MSSDRDRDRDRDREAARRKVLARRATFVAAALAGVSSTVACGKEPGPSVCLKVAPAQSDTAPIVDAAPPLTNDALTDAGPPPSRPCLSVAMPRTETDAGSPSPCLHVTPKKGTTDK